MQLVARDLRILSRVYELRFVTRDHIQALEFAPTTASYCKRRLALLFHHAYLDRTFIPLTPGFGATRPIYTLAARGARIVGHELKTDLDWRASDKNRELYFLQHTLAINDFRICAILAAQRLGLSLDWVDERTLRRREMKDYVSDPKRDGAKLAIVPDGYFRLDDASFALELDRSTVEEKPFKTKVRAYGNWKLSGTYKKRYDTESLRVLFVIASKERDPHRLERIKRWSEAEGARSLFWFADSADVTEHDIFTQPVWQVAGRDGRYALLTGGGKWSGGSLQRDTSSPSLPGQEPG